MDWDDVKQDMKQLPLLFALMMPWAYVLNVCVRIFHDGYEPTFRTGLLTGMCIIIMVVECAVLVEYFRNHYKYVK